MSLIKPAIFSFFALVFNATVANSSEANSIKFDLVPLQLGAYQIKVQLADTTEKRMQGLMGQKPLQHGLILLYEEPRLISLWMKNTPSALDVAFIDQNWQIRQINQMEPFSLTTHQSKEPAIAALEMPLGWFKKHQITIGTKVHYCPAKRQYCEKQQAKLQIISGV